MRDDEVAGYIGQLAGLSAIDFAERRQLHDTGHESNHGRIGGVSLVEYDDPFMVSVPPKFPTRVAILAPESEALLSVHADDLIVADPAAIPDLQVGMVSDETVIWLAAFPFTPTRRFISSATVGRPMSLHWRMLAPAKIYSKQGIIWNAKTMKASVMFGDGKALREYNGKMSREASQNVVAIASCLEQITAQWTVEIRTGSSHLVVGSDRDDLKELYDTRLEPTDSMGRRKKILHWVRRHARLRRGKPERVVGHTRGIEMFHLGEWQITLVPPISLISEHQRPDLFQGTLAYDVYSAWRRTA